MYCHFFLAEDGQHIYMHNLNVRMLVKEYGSLENAPPIIKAKIVEIDSVSMTEVGIYLFIYAFYFLRKTILKFQHYYARLLKNFVKAR